MHFHLQPVFFSQKHCAEVPEPTDTALIECKCFFFLTRPIKASACSCCQSNGLHKEYESEIIAKRILSGLVSFFPFLFHVCMFVFQLLFQGISMSIFLFFLKKNQAKEGFVSALFESSTELLVGVCGGQPERSSVCKLFNLQSGFCLDKYSQDIQKAHFSETVRNEIMIIQKTNCTPFCPLIGWSLI